MIIPQTDLQFGFRVWPDHVTFYTTVADHTDLTAAREVIEWCSEEFGPPYGDDSEGDIYESWFSFLELPASNIRVKSGLVNTYWKYTIGSFNVSFYLPDDAAKFRLIFNTHAANSET